MIKPYDDSCRFDYDLTADSIAIDLGGYEGWYTEQLRKKFDCRVICVEPVPEFFEACYRKFANDPKVQMLNFAVGGERATVDIGVKGSMSGLFTRDANGTASCGLIPISDLFDVIEKATGKRTVDLLAMNIEGSEFPVLEEMIRTSLMPSVRHLLVQPHGVVPDAENRWKRIRRRLLNTHDLTFCTDWCWEGYSIRKEVTA